MPSSENIFVDLAVELSAELITRRAADLRDATPAVIEVLLSASQDVSYVQQDAVEAAARFRHLSEEFSHETSLTPLA